MHDLRIVREIVDDNKDTVHATPVLLHLLMCLRNSLLPPKDFAQLSLVPVVEPRGVPGLVHSQYVCDVLLNGLPGRIQIDRGRPYVDPFEEATVQLIRQNHVNHQGTLTGPLWAHYCGADW